MKLFFSERKSSPFVLKQGPASAVFQDSHRTLSTTQKRGATKAANLSVESLTEASFIFTETKLGGIRFARQRSKMSISHTDTSRAVRSCGCRRAGMRTFLEFGINTLWRYASAISLFCSDCCLGLRETAFLFRKKTNVS